MKLTKGQFKIMSDIVYRYKNTMKIDLDKYSSRITPKLFELNLINVFYEIKPTEVGINTYLENLKRNIILINKDDKKICLDKKKENGWEFIWFMTKEKLGGGFISNQKLLEEYIIY